MRKPDSRPITLPYISEYMMAVFKSGSVPCSWQDKYRY